MEKWVIQTVAEAEGKRTWWNRNSSQEQTLNHKSFRLDYDVFLNQLERNVPFKNHAETIN